MSNYLFENARQLAGQRLSDLEMLYNPGFASSTSVLFTPWGRRP